MKDTLQSKQARSWLRKGERAQSLVEFALVLPLFLTIVLATIDFGWALRSYITATNSAREGARLGVTGATEQEIKDRTVSFSAGLLTGTNVSVSNARGGPGEAVKVQVDYNYNYLTPLGNLISMMSGGTVPTPLPMKTATTMRLE